MILVKDGMCQCENCGSTEQEKYIDLVDSPYQYDSDIWVCSGCKKLYYQWKKSLDRR